MPMVESSILINAPPAALFALSQDYALRRTWDPFVREMRFLDGATEARAGVRVWVRSWIGLTMEVQFTGFRPPASVAMKMLHGPWFLDRFAGAWLFKPRADGKSEVIFRYFFTARWLRRLLNPIIACVFRHDIRARLRGLKYGAEQGGLLERLGEPCA